MQNQIARFGLFFAIRLWRELMSSAGGRHFDFSWPGRPPYLGSGTSSPPWRRLRARLPMATKIASAAKIQAVPHQDPKKPRRTPDTIVSPKKNQRSALAASVTSSSSRMRTSFRSSFRWNATVTGCTRSNPSTLAIWMKTIQRYMPSSRRRADGAATPSAHFPRGLHADFRQVRERLAHPFGRVLVVLELAVHVALVRTQVEVTVTLE